MRVLGIEVAGSNTQLILLDGTAKVFKIEIIAPSKLPLPADPDEVGRLIAQAAVSTADPRKKKPPVNVKAAPKERKNAALSLPERSRRAQAVGKD